MVKEPWQAPAYRLHERPHDKAVEDLGEDREEDRQTDGRQGEPDHVAQDEGHGNRVHAQSQERVREPAHLSHQLHLHGLQRRVHDLLRRPESVPMEHRGQEQGLQRRRSQASGPYRPLRSHHQLAIPPHLRQHVPVQHQQGSGQYCRPPKEQCVRQ